ncbi:MAG: response regulator [Alphaproteobacteria bacterium]
MEKSQGPLERLSFLVVEDSANMRLLIRSVLKGFGAKTIHESENGTAAFDWLKCQIPDMVICDFHMDGINGLQFTRLVRTHRESPDRFLPIIMVSSYGSRGHVLSARDAGVTEFLVKPFTPKSLYDRITAIVHHPRRFVRTKTYFGPDRRRHDGTKYSGPKRRAGEVTGPEETPRPAEKDMHQDDINELFNP